MGRGVRRDRPQARADPRASTAATRSAPTSATRTRTTSTRSLYGRVLLKALGTRNIFSATTVDQMPKHVSAGLMFGAPLSIPIPDVDRTDHLLMLGANPLASNGSLLTAPDMRGRLRAIRERGGQHRRGRPAPQPHGRGRRRAPLHPPGDRRPSAVRDRARAVRGGPRRPGRRRRALRGARRGSSSSPRGFAPEAVDATCAASRPARSGAWRASWRPPSARRSTGGSAPARRSSARWRAGSSTC